MSETTVAVQRCIEQINAGNSKVRDELMSVAFERLQRIAKKMKNGYERVGRWEQTDDVVQKSAIRLYQSLQTVQIQDARHFYRLAALQIRRELIDMARHYHGRHGMGAHHHTHQRMPGSDASAPADFDLGETSEDPHRMQQWSEFHEAVGELPEREREVFELLWYHDLSQEAVAELVGLSVRQIKRLWRSAKINLQNRLGDAIE